MADATLPLPQATVTTTAPDYARGFRVQRPKQLIDDLWDMDLGLSSSDESDPNPAVVRRAVQAAALLRPKACPPKAVPTQRPWPTVDDAEGASASNVLTDGSLPALDLDLLAPLN